MEAHGDEKNHTTMLRLFLGLQAAARAAANTGARATAVRSISTSTPSLAKKKKGKGKGRDAEEEETPVRVVPEVDFKAVEADYKKVLEAHRKELEQIKSDRSDPLVFDLLVVRVKKEELPFTDVAQTLLGPGRQFTITVFDPHDVKQVVLAVAAMNKGFTPMADEHNPHGVAVPLPPPLMERQMEIATKLKAAFNKYKLGSRGTLSKVRERYMKGLDQKGSDDERKLVKKLEQYHTQYRDAMEKEFKEMERQTLKKK